MPDFQSFFPFNPSYSSWENFNGNLIMYYGQEPIPYTSEQEWQHTAKNIAQLPIFAIYPIPDPSQFAKWQDWAYELTLILNGKPRA